MTYESVDAIFLRALARADGLLRKKRKIQLRTNNLRALIVLCPIAKDGSVLDAPERPIEECILEAIGANTMYAKAVAEKSGYAYSSHLRETLSKMVKEGRLRQTLEGYVAAEPSKKRARAACCSPGENEPCTPCDRAEVSP